MDHEQSSPDINEKKARKPSSADLSCQALLCASQNTLVMSVLHHMMVGIIKGPISKPAPQNKQSLQAVTQKYPCMH